jgi:outer membrane protein assembly factor BamE
MKKTFALLLIGFILCSCTILRVHKNDVEQGNVITEENVSRLHTGMTQAQVKAIMGTPELSDTFSTDRLEYVYTFEKGHGQMQTKRVTLLFSGGTLREIIRH